MPLFAEWARELRDLSRQRFEGQRREWVRQTASVDTADRLTRSLALYDAEPSVHLSLASAGVDPERDAGVWARVQAASQVYRSSPGSLVGNRGRAGELVDPGGPRPVYRSTGDGPEELVGFTGVDPGDGERLARVVSLLGESQPTGHGARNVGAIGTGHGSPGAVRTAAPVMTTESLVRAVERGYVDVDELLELEAQVSEAENGGSGRGLFGQAIDIAGAFNPIAGLISAGTGGSNPVANLIADNPLTEKILEKWSSAVSVTPIDDYLEPAINVGVTVLDTPYQLTQAAARSAYRDWNADGFGMFVPDSFDLKGLQEFTTGRAIDIGLQTSVGTMAADIGEEFHGSIPFTSASVPRTIDARPGFGVGEGVNIGEGYFYSGPGEEARSDYARGVAEIDGSTFTIGRYLASPFDAGSKPHTILSGLVDATLALAGPGELAIDSAFDAALAARSFRTTEGGIPAVRLGDAFISADNADDVTALLRGAGAEFTDADVAGLVSSTTMAQADTILRNVGLDAGEQVPQGSLEALRSRWGAIRGIRPTIDSRAVEAYLDGRAGNRAIGLIADTDSTHVIDQITRRSLAPERLARYADESDPTVIRAMLGEDLGLHITGGLRQRRSPITVDAVRDFVPRVSRAGHAVPSGTFDLEDGRRLLDQLSEWGANSGANTATIARWHDRMSRAASRSERNAVIGEFFVETGIRSQVHGIGSGADDIIPELQKMLPADADVDDVLDRLLTHQPPATGDARLDTQLERFRRNSEHMWKLWGEDAGRARAYAVNYNAGSLEEAARGLPVAIDGEEVVLSPETVHLHNETINRHVPMPDAREMRRHFSQFRGILTADTGVLSISPKVYRVLLGIQSGLWKPAVLLRMAWPVRVIGEEQLRLAAGGYTSMAWTPLQHIAAILGDGSRQNRIGRALSSAGVNPLDPLRRSLGDETVDLLGNRFALADEFQQALSTRPRGGTHGRGRDIFDTLLEPEDRAYQLWADELAKLANDQTAIMYLRAGSLDEAKQVFWEGMGSTRRDLAASARFSQRESTFDLLTREGADAYVETVAKRVQEVAGNNPEVIEAMRARGLGDVPMARGDQVNPDFLQALRQHGESMPRFLPGWVPDTASRRMPTGEQITTEATEWMFSMLMGVNTDKLSRSPVFRQEYWNEVAAIVPRVNRVSARRLLDKAKASGVDRSTIDQLRRTIGTQIGPNDVPLSAVEADLLAKGAALDRTQSLLFDISKRNQFFDSLSLVFPFGDAWAEVLTRWMSLVRDDPMVVRRAEQVIEAGRETGFFYENDRGEEVFAYPLSGWMMENMSLMPGVGTAAPIPLTGRLAGLSLATEVYPGLGPVASLGAAAVLPDSRDWDWLRDVLFPYGEPDPGGNPLETLVDEHIPVHWRRVATGLSQDAMTDTEQRQYATTFGQVLGLLGDTGEYDVFSSDPKVARDEWTRLMDDAHEANGALWFGRGLSVVAGGAPSSPSPEFYYNDTSGNAVHISAVRELYQRVWEENPDDPLGAFLAEYDIWALMGVQGKTISQYFGGGVPPTAEAEVWVRDNEDFVDQFELVAGYFAPQGGDIDFNAWNRQLDDGDRIPLTEDQMVGRFLHTLGTFEYNKARDAVVEEWEEAGWDMSGTYPVQVRRWLEDLDADLIRRYGSVVPSGGYQGRSSRWNGPSSSDDATAREMLRGAIEDPAVSDTPLAGAVRTYFETLDSTDALYRDHYPEGTTNWYTANDGQPYRQYVVDMADYLIAETPEFRAVWEEAFEPLIRQGLESDLESEE